MGPLHASPVSPTSFTNTSLMQDRAVSSLRFPVKDRIYQIAYGTFIDCHPLVTELRDSASTAHSVGVRPGV